MGELFGSIYCGEVNTHASIEHIYNELSLLDLMLKIQVSEFCNSAVNDPLEAFKGLVISEEQVRDLLEDKPYDLSLDVGIQNLYHLHREKEQQVSDTYWDITITEKQTRLQQLAQLLGLNRFHIQCIIICLAVELDTKYQKIYGYLHDDINRKKPTLDLITRLLCNTAEDKIAARAQLDSSSPLIRYNIIQRADNHDSHTSLISCPLKLDDGILDYLLGSGTVDTRIQSMTSLKLDTEDPVNTSIENKPFEDMESLARHLSWVEQELVKPTILYYYGAQGAGKKTAVESACKTLHKPVLFVDMAGVEKQPAAPYETLHRIFREAVLKNAAICFINTNIPEEVQGINTMLKLIEGPYKNHIFLIFIIGEQPWKPPVMNDGVVFILKEFNIPDELERKILWENAALRFPISQGVDWGELAGKFRFTPGQINSALDNAYVSAGLRSSGSILIDNPDIYQACLNLSRSKLDELAQRIRARYTWKDIVLPEHQIEQLKSICDQVKYSHVVYGTWGFGKKLSRGKGLSVLFAGPPGTGKTMAAEIMANELGLELYRIDLSRVVSKYIGETEKNLQKIFDEASTSNAILFFDEADALFGKRSEVKDAHDRYANIEISYLLQKMEEYQGVTLLATNLRNNIDEAFMRRIQFLVEFPYPDENYRELIWKVIFPENIPLDKSIDYGAVARRIRLAGGNIKNIALNAAFYAAAENSCIRMDHIEKAASLEHKKVGKIWE